MMLPLQNAGNEEVIFEEIRILESRGVGDVIRVLDIEMATRVDGVDHPVPLGRYVTDPPTAFSFGECRVQELEGVGGYLLPPMEGPGDAALVAFHIETLRAGRALIEGQEIFHSVDGQRYVQEFPFRIQVDVDADAAPSKMHRSERRCLTDDITPLIPVRS